MAATDLLVGAVIDPLSVTFHYSEALNVQSVSIKTVHILFFVLSTASLLTLAALTVERYIAVAFPYKYKTTLTSKRVPLVTVVIWSISLGLSFLYFPLGYIYYSFIFENVVVVSTLLVLLFVYWRMYKKLTGHIKMFGKNNQKMAYFMRRREKNKDR